MKKLLAIFLLISGSLQAQDTLDSDSSESVNERILDYVHDYMGKKVGQGVCRELIFGAVSYIHRQGIALDSMCEINISDVKAGDVIVLDSVIFSNGDEIFYHTGIVYNVHSDKSISYANQNIGLSPNNSESVLVGGYKEDVEKDSHVLLSSIDPLLIVSGKIKIFSPSANSQKRKDFSTLVFR